MIYLPQKLREYRKRRGMTQENAAEALGVAPQTVSKWERGETYPDVLMLPALAHLFGVSTDALLGMDEMSAHQRRGEAYTQARIHMRRHDWNAAVSVYEEALSIWPENDGLMCDLAMALALHGGPEQLSKAAGLCLRVLEGQAGLKVQHTARAALCYIYHKMGDKDRSAEFVRQLPHTRESREVVHERLNASTGQEDEWLYELSTGEKW